MKSLKIANSNLALLSGIIFSVLYFPVWWYSLGFFRFAKRIFSFWREQAFSLAVLVWLKNIFTPMYGQSDFVGRLISFGVRLVQVIIRSFILLIWLIICLIIILFWPAFPFLLILATISQLS
jgi:hypothetical protein